MQKQTERAAAAVKAVFPSPESLDRFLAESENRSALDSLINFAWRNQLIKDADLSLLSDFIIAGAGSRVPSAPPKNLDFETFFEQKDTLMALNISVRALTMRINALLTEERIDLPMVSNSMLSRLKREPADTNHKQNVLRSLAFWLGYERSHLGSVWNYETLLMLCSSDTKHVSDHKEGVRIGFALYSRGDVIDHEIVGWLKKNLKAYIESSVFRFSYGGWGKIKSHNITTLYVDFPKEGNNNNPAAYRQSMRSAVSLAHQAALRWILSGHFTRNRFLSIGITAGDFEAADNYLLPVLSANLPGDPVIRFTDYARQCALINDIRVLFCPVPSETSLFSGETLRMWWVTGLWSTLYFDFIPDLLEDPMLQNDAGSMERLSAILFGYAQSDELIGEKVNNNAVDTFFRFPHNTLLGLEIAKTLYYRRRFREAIEILRIVLSLDPTQLNARTLRLVLLRNLAVDATSPAVAEGLFRQAHQEADYIRKNCDFQSEDFYCEYAVLSLAQAMTDLRYMRNNGVMPGSDAEKSRQRIFARLYRAEYLFGMGMTVSPTGIRANYLLNTAKVISTILRTNNMIFADPKTPVDGPFAIVKQAAGDIHRQLGYFREDLPVNQSFRQVEKIFHNHAVSHNDSISLQAYRPTTYFCTAVGWWDLSPQRTVANAKNAVNLLKSAADLASDMEKKGLCIYSFTRTYGEMMVPETFIHHMNRGIKMIESQAGENFYRADDQSLIACRDPACSSMLMTLNF